MCFCLGACVCTRGICVCIGGMSVYLGVCLHVQGAYACVGYVSVGGRCVCGGGMYMCKGHVCVLCRRNVCVQGAGVCMQGTCTSICVQGHVCMCRGHMGVGHVCVVGMCVAGMCVCRGHVCIIVSMQRTEKAQSLTSTCLRYSPLSIVLYSRPAGWSILGLSHLHPPSQRHMGYRCAAALVFCGLQESKFRSSHLCTKSFSHTEPRYLP